MAERGRPSKLTPQLQNEIATLLRAGNFVETVCDYVGIHRGTFYEWLRRGERGWKIDQDGGYVDFSDTVKKAIASVEITTLNELRQGPMNWQAKAWWLERRHPDKWGNRQKLQHVGGDDGPIEVADATTARERIASRIAAMAERVGTDENAESADGETGEGA